MNNRPLNNQNFAPKSAKRVAHTRPDATPWVLLILVVALHLTVGLLLSIFSPPAWVWPLAFGGTFIQAVALAGPRALSSLRGVRILLCRSFTCLGVGLSVAGLAVAVGFGGSADIDSIQFSQTGLTLFFVNLGVLLLTAGCSILLAQVGDRLLAKGLGRARSSLAVLSICLLGLFVGGAFGLAIAS